MTTRFIADPGKANYCLMGNPVAHSKSPQIHQAFARQLGQDIVYQAILVDRNDFSAALEKFRQEGGRGLNITVPFKGNAWEAADNLTPRAVKAEAVNTMWFSEDGSCFGDTTDGVGLVTDLTNNRVGLTGKRVLILGAGGAVRGVLPNIHNESPAQIVIANRTADRAQQLVTQFQDYTELDWCAITQLPGKQFDVVIHGTTAGLQGELLPLPDDILADHACCYDMVYGNDDTVFGHWAREHGADTSLDGLGMLVEQAAESFYLWRGIRPDTDPVIEMLRQNKL